MANSAKDERIMRRLHEHLDAVTEKHPRWVGIFLQGSQNYGLDYDGSDIDSKLITLPSFEDFVLNRKPVSYTHIMDNNEHVDVKDIRLMFECFRKQNINFVEILFTKYRILNPVYEDSYMRVLNIRERIGRYNNYAALNCICGTAYEKQKALCHPYPATIEKINRFGYDPKQLHHILRLSEFMIRWIKGEPYQDCLVSKLSDMLVSVKKDGAGMPVDEALGWADYFVSTMKKMKDNYMDTHGVEIDRGVDEILNSVLVEMFKKAFVLDISDDDAKGAS